MTYISFLGICLVIPLIGWGLLLWRCGLPDPRARWQRSSWWPVILGHAVAAVAYTTPWDNYLVATGVWWYDQNKVLGLILGWVPIEEYAFFVLQTMLGGLWLMGWSDRCPAVRAAPSSVWARVVPCSLVIVAWLGALAILVIGWRPGTYLGLELIWALPPIALQVAYGGHWLWQHRSLVSLVMLSMTAYLSLCDAWAIASGIWTIDPSQSLGILIGGVLPLEEFLFFFLTTTMVVQGIVLVMASPTPRWLRWPGRATRWSV